MLDHLFFFKATFIRACDGDSAYFDIDCGFRTWHKANCRFFGINTPELTSSDPETRDRAKQARDRVEATLTAAKSIVVHSRLLDKYGRPLVDVYYQREKDGEFFHLNKELIGAGFAVPYMG